MKPRPPLRHEDAVLVLALGAAVIPILVALPLIWFGDLDLKSRVTLTLLVGLAGIGLAFAARSRVQRPLQTLANLIAALRERDYSVRGRHPRLDDALGLAMGELSELTGPDLDRRFLELMIDHHNGAIRMARAQLEDGENTDAMGLARTIIDDQMAEITEMTNLLNEL